MAPQVQELEQKVDRLERLFLAYIKQDEHKDWLDKPEIVAMLDEAAQKEPSLPEDKVEF